MGIAAINTIKVGKHRSKEQAVPNESTPNTSNMQSKFASIAQKSKPCSTKPPRIQYAIEVCESLKRASPAQRNHPEYEQFASEVGKHRSKEQAVPNETTPHPSNMQSILASIAQTSKPCPKNMSSEDVLCCGPTCSPKSAFAAAPRQHSVQPTNCLRN